MLTFTDLLGQTVAELDTDGTDPDGPVTRRGLLLAAHAGLTVHRFMPHHDQWGLYAVAIDEAIAILHADLSNDLVLGADTPEAGIDEQDLRNLVRSLVSRLAQRYAEAAAGLDPDDPCKPWRRQVWAKVANRLDDAASQLT